MTIRPRPRVHPPHSAPAKRGEPCVVAPNPRKPLHDSRMRGLGESVNLNSPKTPRNLRPSISRLVFARRHSAEEGPAPQNVAHLLNARW